MRFLILLMALFGACDRSVAPELAARLRVSVHGDFHGVDSGYAEVSGPSMTLQRTPLALTDSTAWCEHAAVPRGADRRVEVRLFDGLFLCYYGDAAIDILDSASQAIELLLLPVERPLQQCRSSGLSCDTAGGNYRLTWTPYEDTLQFRAGRSSYVVVKDTVPISNDFNSYTGDKVIFWENPPDTSFCEWPIGNDIGNTYFKMFLYLENYRMIVSDCENAVFFR